MLYGLHCTRKCFMLAYNTGMVSASDTCGYVVSYEMATLYDAPYYTEYSNIHTARRIILEVCMCI